MNSTTPEQPLRDHVDRLRGAFAVCVLLGHAIDLAYGVSAVDPAFPIVMAIRPLLGFVWVVGFIVLSGFCVARSCERSQRQTVGGYAALRASRLLPMLWMCLLCAGIIETLIADSPHRPKIWTQGIDSTHFLLNFAGIGGFYGTYGSLAPAYTLSYEIAFYVLWAIAWFGTGRRKWASMSVALVISLVLFAGARNLLPVNLRIVVSDFVLLLFLCWCMGAALALWLPKFAASRVVRSLAAARWFLVWGVAAAGFALVRMPLLEATQTSLVYYLLLALAFVLSIAGFVRKRPGSALLSRLDGHLGEISYPLFLSHGPIIMGLATLYRSSGIVVPFSLYVLALCVPAVVVAAGLTVLVDRPVMAYRDRFRRRTRVPQTARDPQAPVAV